MTTRTMVQLDLAGLRLGSPQTLGAIRMVPLVRDRIASDLRLAERRYDALGIVSVDRHRPEETGLKYIGFVPHGYILSYSNDGEPVAALGASFGAPKAERSGPRCVRLLHRMVKREASVDDTSRVRLLPLHLAMEGFLALQFRGPEILWREYSAHARRFGLDPRVERTARGTWLAGLEEALRVFEIVPAQVGVLLFVAEALACAFVVPHPDDYRALHRALLEDFFGELLVRYATLYPHVPSAWESLSVSESAARTVGELAGAVERVRKEWRDYAELLAGGLFDRPTEAEIVRSMGPFTLQRFLPTFDPEVECHIGERIVRSGDGRDGELMYLKTFRLSSAQIRRAYLLVKLAEASWKIDDAAALLKTSRQDFIQRMGSAGFGYLLQPELQAELRREQERRPPR